VFWVSLAAVADPAAVEGAIAHVLGAKDSLADTVDEKRMLLLLDNFEQLVEAAPRLATLLAACPNLRLLVTSRALLRLDGESEYCVEPLPADDAVTLFEERAAVSEPASAVAEVCRRLDGLPLAIELAAARTRVLPPDRLLARLDRRLPLLTHGRRDAPERQRTLRATIEWSFDLLPPEQQALFARLAVFAGSFEAEVAEEVVDARLDDLEALVEQSLLRRWGGGRLGMLETIREFAADTLSASGDADGWSIRHAEWMAALLEAADPELYGPKQADWLERLEREQDELRRALDIASTLPDPSLHFRLLASACYFWYLHGDSAQAVLRLEEARPSLPDAEPRLQMLILAGLAIAKAWTGDVDGAVAPAEASVAIARALPMERAVLRALATGAVAALRIGDLPTAEQLWDECVDGADALGNAWFRALALTNLAVPQFMRGEYASAAATAAEALAAAEAAGDDYLAAGNLANLGFAEFLCGDIESAVESWGRGLRRSRRVRSPEVLIRCLEGLAAVAAERSRPHEAATVVGAVDALVERSRYELFGLESVRRRQTLESLRGALAEDELEAARSAGGRMTLEDAIDYAVALDL
jgi:predicted ATPase